MSHVRDSPGGCLLSVHVIPRAKRSEIAGVRGDALLVRLAAPPVDGAANAALIDLLSTVFSIPKSRVTLASGERARQKTVRLEGVPASAVAALVTRAPEP